jgi:uncharacterized membrane protein
MRLQTTKYQQGFGIVESMLAAMILLFVLSSGFIILNSILVSIALDNRKEELSAALNERVSIYRITGVFDDSSTSSGIEFKKTITVEQENGAEPIDEEKPVNRFKRLSVADMKKMAQRADKKAASDASKDVKITYKVINIAAFDDVMEVADRIKVIERKVEVADSDEE